MTQEEIKYVSFLNTSIQPTIIQLFSYYCNSRLCSLLVLTCWNSSAVCVCVRVCVFLPWADLFGDVSQVVELSHVLRRADVTIRSDS